MTALIAPQTPTDRVAAPYGAFLDDLCRVELGMGFDQALACQPDEARAILRHVLTHRWPHLRRRTA